jgi:predicted metal-dependent enzyme (double-stranded beta helix superfamily)
VIAAPANHQVIYEDDDVRVLLVTLRPHQRENPHDHPWPSIMAILDGSLKVGNVDARGDPAPVRPLPPGFVLPAVIRSAPEALHSNYNSDPDKSFRAIRIEYKHGFPKNPSQ